MVVGSEGGQSIARGKKFTAEQIIGKLREAEVELARGKKVPGDLPQDWCDGADVLPLEEGVRRAADGPGEAAEEARKRERSSEATSG